MSTISITWTVETDGDPETLGRTLVEYVTHPDCPLLTDYGDNAAREDDGYEGPLVLSSKATYQIDPFTGQGMTVHVGRSDQGATR